MGQEIELKFIGPEDALARLRDSSVLKRLAARRRAKTRALKSVYFDTDDFALRNACVVLRVRDEGNGFVQTVKTIGGPDAATRMKSVRRSRRLNSTFARSATSCSGARLKRRHASER